MDNDRDDIRDLLRRLATVERDLREVGPALALLEAHPQWPRVLERVHGPDWGRAARMSEGAEELLAEVVLFQARVKAVRGDMDEARTLTGHCEGLAGGYLELARKAPALLAELNGPQGDGGRAED